MLHSVPARPRLGNAHARASAGVVAKLALKGVGGCAASPAAGAPALAAFVPEAKGAPGYVGVWTLDQLAPGADLPAPVARRTFFRVRAARARRGRRPMRAASARRLCGRARPGLRLRLVRRLAAPAPHASTSEAQRTALGGADAASRGSARQRRAGCQRCGEPPALWRPPSWCGAGGAQASSVTLLWNTAGTALLALTASDTDATNQSYYGEQKLHFLAADGSLDCLVPVPKVRPALRLGARPHAGPPRCRRFAVCPWTACTCECHRARRQQRKAPHMRSGCRRPTSRSALTLPPLTAPSRSAGGPHP